MHITPGGMYSGDHSETETQGIPTRILIGMQYPDKLDNIPFRHYVH